MTAPAAEERFVSAGGRRTRLLAAGAGPPLVLLHGWPMTARAFRHVMAPLAAAGWGVLAPDLPGLGGSDEASAGYDTVAVAGDVLAALRALGHERAAVVGHDVGAMVAVSLALAHPEAVAALCVGEFDAPGLGTWDEAWRNPRLWHFHFHGTPGLPETVLAGREREYLRFFYERDGRTPGAWSEDDLDGYARAYAAPDRLRAGFDYYRAFPRSAERNRALFAARGKLRHPLLAMGGEHSLGAGVERSMRGVAERVEGLVFAGSGHFLPEERPAEFARAAADFLSRHGAGTQA